MELQEHIYIRRILDGETNLFGHLVESHSQAVFLLIVQIVRNREDAEELTQDVFLKAYRNLKSFRGDCRLSTWLHRIAYTSAISAARRKKQEFLYMEEETINNISDQETDEILDNRISQNQLDALQKSLSQLPPDERGMITLYYNEQKTIEEIAFVTGLTAANVKVRLHRTRKKLCLMLKKEQNN